MNWDGETALYRLFDADGELLYVGVARDYERRREHHAKHKSWWGDVADERLEFYPSRSEALAAERKAIRAEVPKHNVQGGPAAPCRAGGTTLLRIPVAMHQYLASEADRQRCSTNTMIVMLLARGVGFRLPEGGGGIPLTEPHQQEAR